MTRITIMVDMRTPMGLRKARDRRAALEAKGYGFDPEASSPCRWVLHRASPQHAVAHDGENPAGSSRRRPETGGRHPMQALSWEEFKARGDKTGENP